MTDKSKKDGGSKDNGPHVARRDFLKTAGASAAALGVVAGASSTANANVPSQGYQPTDKLSVGQWPSWATTNLSEFPSDDPKEVEVWGYAGKQSYAPGDTLNLHINVNPNGRKYSVEIVRDGAECVSIYKKEGLVGAKHDTPIKAYTEGCGWPVSHTLKIPSDWKSGAYVVIFRIQDGKKVKEQEAFFILRAAKKTAKIAFVAATSTWNAYNN
jgi:hypothetical protein